ncbi:hypothetical protein BHE74_00001041 [Ensete ventricosum]|nr:hypothetical protein BHE74_00001041 [Ensete ventricosum]
MRLLLSPPECFAVAPGFPFGQPLRLADLVTVESFSGDVVSQRPLGAGPTVIRLRTTRDSRKPGNFCRAVRSNPGASSFPPPPALHPHLTGLPFLFIPPPPSPLGGPAFLDSLELPTLIDRHRDLLGRVFLFNGSLADRKGSDQVTTGKSTSSSNTKKNKRRQKKSAAMTSAVQRVFETCKEVFADGGPGIVPSPDEVERLRSVLVLDVLGPPYDEEEGRACTYYRGNAYSNLPGMYAADHRDGLPRRGEREEYYAWLEERGSEPDELVVRGAEYKGPRIVDH